MKLKKIRVCLKDIHHGKILYVAHPRFGIVKKTVIGKPYLIKSVGSLLVKVRIDAHSCVFDKGYYESISSLYDMGIDGFYGYRRTFHTRKQAERYIQRFKQMANEHCWP